MPKLVIPSATTKFPPEITVTPPTPTLLSPKGSISEETKQKLKVTVGTRQEAWCRGSWYWRSGKGLELQGGLAENLVHVKRVRVRPVTPDHVLPYPVCSQPSCPPSQLPM